MLLALAAILLILGAAGLLKAEALQEQAAIAYTGSQLSDELAGVLSRPAATPALNPVVRKLLEREPALFRVVVRDPGGLLLAHAGRYDEWAYGDAGLGHVAAAALYRLYASAGSAPVRDAEGRTVGQVDFDVTPSAVDAVHDHAVAQLQLTGWLLLGCTLLVVAAVIWLLRRRRHGADWRVRADPGRDARNPPSADAGDVAFRERGGVIMDGLQYGILSADRDGRVRYLNGTAERLTGWSLAAARGRMTYSVVHLVDAYGAPMQTVLEAALQKSGEAPTQQGWLKARDGIRRPVELQASLLRHAEAHVDGAIMLFRDITHHTIEIDRLRREARLSQAIVDHLDEGVLVTDPSGLVRFANARAMRMFGYTREELQSFTVAKLMPVPFLNTPGVRLPDYVSSSAADLPKVVGWRHDATTFPVELWVQPLQLEQSSGYVVIVRDISERLRGENLASRLGRLLDAAAEEIYIFDAQSLAFLEVNRGARRNLGYRAEALLRMTPLDISDELDETRFNEYLDKLRDGGQESIVYRCRHRRRDGTNYPVEVRLNLSREEQPPVFMAIAADISERLEGEARLEQLAHYDALTGLPNRVMLRDRLHQAVIAQRRSDRMLAVLFLDVDRFKQINDAYGHDIGDQVLRATAERLVSMVRESDTVARLAGDEFVIVAPGLRDAEDAAQLAQKLIDRFAQPLPIPGFDLVSQLSIGLTLHPLDDGNEDVLLRHADMAMYEAKQAGRGCYRVFTNRIGDDRRRRLDLEQEIHSAVALNQFQLLMTPVIDTADAAVVAVYAGRYWQHPRFGRIEEDELLRAGARAGLIGDLELWQITHVCEHHLSARERGIETLPFVVDISGWQLRTGSFAQHVDDLLHRYEVPGDRVVLALTPDGLDEASAAQHPAVRALLARGVRLALRSFKLPIPTGAALPVSWLLARNLEAPEQIEATVATARDRGLQLIALTDDGEGGHRWAGAGCHLVGNQTLEAPQMIGWLAGRQVRPL
ncbi:sensor domain-containing protein [Solimonas marina]|uniref:Diguanylate cyclase n=1 Tax=Solimonas marina TaxID=2714601 RepID=A0A970B8I8_9GAMM|nr:diguanylate cyclase [Solimonas marina]NKF21426.1 diguanylate cyclase [Solimonas marina]